MAEKDTKNYVRFDVILVGVLVKFDEQLKATKETYTEVTKEAAYIRVLKGKINT